MRAPVLFLVGTLSAVLLGSACGLSESQTEGIDPATGQPIEPPSGPAVGNPQPPAGVPGTPPAPTPPSGMGGAPAPTPQPPGSIDPTPPGMGGSPPATPRPMPPGATPPTPPSTPPPPPGTPGVTIDGTFIPKDKVIVTLHLGHSNAAGRTRQPANMVPMYFNTNPKLWAYSKGGRFALAKEPLSGDRLTGTNNAGPGMAILHTAKEHAPDLTFVHIGRGHDGSIGGFCRSFRRGALLYNFVMDPAKELKGKVTFAGIFTMLGVNEFRRDNANIPRFNECMAGIASDMREDLGDPNIPFIMGDLEDGARGPFDPSHDYSKACREQLRIASEKIPRAGLIATMGIPMSDDHHYNLVGYKMWAERGFKIMATKDLIPWATVANPPSIE
jgi:hypothetical protein